MKHGAASRVYSVARVFFREPADCVDCQVRRGATRRYHALAPFLSLSPSFPRSHRVCVPRHGQTHLSPLLLLLARSIPPSPYVPRRTEHASSRDASSQTRISSGILSRVRVNKRRFATTFSRSRRRPVVVSAWLLSATSACTHTQARAHIRIHTHTRTHSTFYTRAQQALLICAPVLAGGD